MDQQLSSENIRFHTAAELFLDSQPCAKKFIKFFAALLTNGVFLPLFLFRCALRALMGFVGVLCGPPFWLIYSQYARLVLLWLFSLATFAANLLPWLQDTEVARGVILSP